MQIMFNSKIDKIDKLCTVGHAVLKKTTLFQKYVVRFGQLGGLDKNPFS